MMIEIYQRLAADSWQRHTQMFATATFSYSMHSFEII